MTLAAESVPRSPAPAGTFESLEPATGTVVATFPVDGTAEVRAAVAKVRASADWWEELGFSGRRTHLKRWNALLTKRQGELAELMHRENGKPVADAVLELTLAIGHLDWAAAHAAKILGPKRVLSGLLAANHAATVEYKPLGVVGVIGPWNYPVFTPMGSIAYALAAGNVVVFKPSEFTPAIGRWLADTLAEAVPDHPLMEVVTGFGETGAALCRAGVDKIAFTGSAPTGRKVMAACAENLVPVLMECGGKDALILDDDGDVKAAADAAVWGGMSNAGQTCIGVERVYVTERNYEPFLEAVKERAAGLKAGDGKDASFGPITMPSQLDIISRHIDDALDRGATAIVGGRASVHAPYVDPVVLVDVPDDAPAITDETFGPTLTITKVANADEAVAKANGSGYMLGSAVFGKARAKEIAGRLRSGMTSVNSVLAFAFVPSLPFGGVGESGFGRIHGADGLREFTRAKAVTSQLFALPVPVTSFSRPPVVIKALTKLTKVLHGRG